MSSVGASPVDENQCRLAAELGALRDYIKRRVDLGHSDQPAAALDVPPSALGSILDQLASACGLSRFERSLLLLAVGIELDGEISALMVRVHHDPRWHRPTFGVALALLPDAHWSALCPSRPLRRFRLLCVAPGEILTQSPLYVDERVLHYLVGLDVLDARLDGIVNQIDDAWVVVPSQARLVQRLAEAWSHPASSGRRHPIPVLCGADPSQREGIASGAASQLGIRLFRLNAAALHGQLDRLELVRLWEREALLCNAALFVEWPDGDAVELQRAVAHILNTIQSPVALSAHVPPGLIDRVTVRLDVEPPLMEENRFVWQRSLGDISATIDHHIEAMTAQFHLGPSAILAASEAVLARTEPALSLEKALWTACRMQSRPKLDDLAQRIETLSSWNDLVLPSAQMELLREIADQVRHRFCVYNNWGFSEKTRRGLGITALFAGPTGTGKTMAAEVLAAELDLDLYRIDLSQVVSKYIGETEKNLRRIFDAADVGGSILLFDEADALFGKRSEVKDSHDRYANLEVSYLLQKMEAYRGLAILTTNLKGSLDVAFMRRLRFVVQFPFPDLAQRHELWRRAFPPRTPQDGLNFALLARVSVSGGNIRNIALNAAFMASSEGTAVRMSHLLRATRTECAKLDKSLTDTEVEGWV